MRHWQTAMDGGEHRRVSVEAEEGAGLMGTESDLRPSLPLLILVVREVLVVEQRFVT